jgi:hypothetical protein
MCARRVPTPVSGSTRIAARVPFWVMRTNAQISRTASTVTPAPGGPGALRAMRGSGQSAKSAY